MTKFRFTVSSFQECNVFTINTLQKIAANFGVTKTTQIQLMFLVFFYFAIFPLFYKGVREAMTSLHNINPIGEIRYIGILSTFPQLWHGSVK